MWSPGRRTRTIAPGPFADALSREALRLYGRYQAEVVEARRLCPWAERSRKLGQVEVRVLHARAQQPDALECVLEGVARLEEKADIEVGLLLFPLVDLERREFEHFVADAARLYSSRRGDGRAPFALAAFHPDATPDTTDAERLIPFLRRTPDPTIQLVRLSALERVRRGGFEGTQFVDLSVLSTLSSPPEETLSLRERIARENLATVERVGLATMEAVFAEICGDRDETYRRLGVFAGEPG